MTASILPARRISKQLPAECSSSGRGQSFEPHLREELTEKAPKPPSQYIPALTIAGSRTAQIVS